MELCDSLDSNILLNLIGLSGNNPKTNDQALSSARLLWVEYILRAPAQALARFVKFIH